MRAIQDQIDLPLNQMLPTGGRQPLALQGNDPGGQAEPGTRQFVDPVSEIGRIAGVQQVNHRAMGLGLGGEVGAGGFLDLVTLFGFALVRGVHAGQGDRRKLDDVACGDLQTQFGQQAVVSPEELGIVRQKAPDSGRLQRGLFEAEFTL